MKSIKFIIINSLNELCEVYDLCMYNPQDVAVTLNVVTMDRNDPHASQISVTIPEKSLLFSVGTNIDPNLPQIWESLINFAVSGVASKILLSCINISWLHPLIKALDDKTYTKNRFTQQAIRMGIPYNLRNEIWLGYSGVYHEKGNPVCKPKYCNNENKTKKIKKIMNNTKETFSIVVEDSHVDRATLILESYCNNNISFLL